MGKITHSIRQKRKDMGEEAWEEYQKSRRYKKSLTYKKRNALAVITHRRNKKKKLIEHKGGKCEDCGYSSIHQTAFCFHHINPKEKEINIASNMQLKMETLIKEVDKCQLLCVRCHAELHDKEYEISINERIEEYKNLTEDEIDVISKNRKKEVKNGFCDGCQEEFKKLNLVEEAKLELLYDPVLNLKDISSKYAAFI